MSNVYGPGGTLRFYVKWEALDGVPIQVTATLSLKGQGGTTGTGTVESAIISTTVDKAGRTHHWVEFYANWTAPNTNTIAGPWHYRWLATGDVDAEHDGRFVIRASEVLAS